MMKVALLEASHWHVPLYLEALAAANVDVIAVSDAENAKGPEIAEKFSARFYESYEELLQNEELDFAFAFGRHCDMAAMATLLINRGIPFAMEKPCGVNAGEVGKLNELARQKNIFVSIPLIFRLSALRQNLLAQQGTQGRRWDHMSFRFIAGPPERYIEARCAWMLQKALAAGGCAINLAVHFIDLTIELSRENITEVSARMLEGSCAVDVEVFSSITLATDSGTICNIETGYTYPGGTEEQREFSFSLASDKTYIRSRDDGFLAVPRDGSDRHVVEFELNTDDYYAEFVRESLRAFEKGENPPADLSDMKRVMQVVDCAYASARQGGKLVKNTSA